MNFLAPWYIPAIALAAAVPPLVLLYYLKLKRREVPIASTLLWRRAVEDLRVNSPFQKLRSNLLLFLQLLVLVLAALALSEPFRSGTQQIEQSVVLMIDQSASMATREAGDKTRLELAREEAMQLIDEMKPGTRAMAIAFADRARVLTPFTEDRNVLRQAVQSVQQTDAVGRLAEAMELAEAHSTPIGEGIGTEVEVASSQYLLLTDGRLADSGKVSVQRGRMEVVRIGQAADNLGIVGLDVRRNYEKPELLSIVARVRNFGTEPVDTDVSLFVNGVLKNVRSLKGLAPLAAPDKIQTLPQAGMPPDGNEAPVAYEQVLDTAADLELRLSRADGFPVDNRAWSVVAPPRPLTALLVSPGNRYLRDLMAAMRMSRFDVWTPKEYEEAPLDKLVETGRCRYDVVVLDAHSTERLPPGNYLFFGGVPLIDGVDAGDTIKNGILLDWDDTHPILRHVAVGAVNVFSWLNLTLPPEARSLIEGNNGPVLALLQRERHQHLICAFSFFDETRQMLNTDWVFNEGVVVFTQNAMRFLAGNTNLGQQPPVAPGEAISVATTPGTTSVNVRRPDGTSDQAPVRASGLAAYGRTDRVGLYRLETGIPDQEVRAVNLCDDDESFIAPNRDFHLAGGQVAASAGAENRPSALWPYVLMALGAVLLFEWFIYNKRVFI
ncbi:MAG TPA: VWA domain-containing protein [Phycisphaerae bacterium]|nr:VWA domain-containing protein [Phycisphaerae bacterium]